MANETLQQIPLNTPLNQVLSTAGQPLKESTEGNFKVLWYTSSVPGKSDNFYFVNNNLYAKAWRVDGDVLLQKYLDEFGQPTATYFLYEGVASGSDSLIQTMHVWPEQGLSILTLGKSPASQVIRQYELPSTSLEEYLSQWQVKNVEQKTATIAAATSPVPVEQAKLISATELDSQPGLLRSFAQWQWPLLGLVVIAIFLSVVLFFLRKKQPSIPQ
jgi:hypothetical protein